MNRAQTLFFCVASMIAIQLHAVQQRVSLLSYCSLGQVNALVKVQAKKVFREVKQEECGWKNLEICLNTWNSIRSLDDCVAFLQEYDFLYDSDYNQDIDINIGDINIGDQGSPCNRMRCILLIGMVERAIATSIETLLTVIDRCAVASRYWREQADHNKRRRADEVGLRAQTFLGSLVRVLKDLNINYSDALLYQWISDVSTLYAESLGESVTKSLSSQMCKEAFVVTGQVLDAAERLNDSFALAYAEYKVPSHFQKYWLHYAVAGAVSAYAIRANQNQLTQTVSSLKNSVKKLVADHITDPIKGLFGRRPVQDDFVQELIVSLQGSEDVVKHFNDEIQRIDAQLAPFKSVTVNSDPDFLKNQAAIFKNLAATKKGQYLPFMHETLMSVNDILLRAHDITQKEFSKFALKKEREINTLIVKPLADVIKSGHAIDKELVALLTTIKPILKLSEKVIKKVDFLLEIAVLGAVGYGIYKTVRCAYSWWNHVDYSLLQKVLCDVERLLVIAGSDLTDLEEGMLFYYLSTLKKQALKIIPSTDALRPLFIEDLELLLGDMLDATQKIELIQMMGKRYKFLR
jgi:hypothetical protein